MSALPPVAGAVAAVDAGSLPSKDTGSARDGERGAARPAALGGWTVWYPALVGGLAGAALASVIMQRRLDAELAVRPPVMVANYAVFEAALAHGVKPDALQALAAQYTARVRAIAQSGVVVLRDEAVAGQSPDNLLPPDSTIMAALVSLAQGGGGGNAPQARPADLGDQGGGAHGASSAGGAGDLTVEEAGRLAAALRSGR